MVQNMKNFALLLALFALAAHAEVPTNKQPYNLSNLGVTTSVGSNALTIALKTKDGSTPSASNPAEVTFRSATATAGTTSKDLVTAATSLVISSGSTLGHTNAVPQNIYVYALDNAGTVEVAASSTYYGDSFISSTTAEGGIGTATSYATIYSTTARTSKAMRLIATLKSSQTTAGTWAAVPQTTIVSPSLGASVAQSWAPGGARICAARLNSAGGVDQSDNSCVATNTRNSQGRYTVAFATGFCANTVICVSADASNAGRTCVITSPTSTGLNVSCDTPGVGVADENYHLVCICLR